MQAPSKAAKRAAFTQPSTTTVLREEEKEEEACLRSCLDLNGNIHMPGDAAGDCREGTEAPSAPVQENEAALDDFELRSQESQHFISQGRVRQISSLHGGYTDIDKNIHVMSSCYIRSRQL